MAIVAGWVLARYNPAAYWFWPKCPVKLLTGLNCPACGIQRFVHAAANGHLAEALAYNYYLVYALPYTLLVVAIYFLPPSKLRQRMADVFESRCAIGLYVVSYCVWFVVRNLLGL